MYFKQHLSLFSINLVFFLEFVIIVFWPRRRVHKTSKNTCTYLLLQLPFSTIICGLSVICFCYRTMLNSTRCERVFDLTMELSIAAANFARLVLLKARSLLNKTDYLDSNILPSDNNLKIPGPVRSDHSSNEKRGSICIQELQELFTFKNHQYQLFKRMC